MRIMKKEKISAVLMLIVLVVALKMVLISCAKDKTPVITEIVLDSVCPDTVFYETEIKTLMDQNCSTSGCHDPVTHAQGLDLSTYANVATNAQAILASMKPDAQPLPMPLGQNLLPDSVVQRFDCWIKQGKLEN